MASEAARIIDFQEYRRRRARTSATVSAPPSSPPRVMLVWVPVLPMISFAPMPWAGPFPA